MKTNKAAEKQARKMGGDGKAPNKYFVSMSHNYLTNKGNESNVFDWASDSYKDLPEDSVMLGSYDTFKKALAVAESQYLPSPEEDFNGFHLLQIEDRLCGIIYEIIWCEHHKDGRFPSITFDLSTHDDTKFTREIMEAEHIPFI
jgi:hypothetical protein